VKITRAKMPENPWKPETTPITLTAPAKKLPKWGLVLNDRMADEVPDSPASSTEPLEQITLVPFGAQTLRITAFPLLRGKPMLEPGLTLSHKGEAIEPILSGSPPPASSAGEGVPRFTFWNHVGTSEWIRWTFEKQEPVSAVSIYWFDDSGSGKCRVPESWNVEYLKEGDWLPVKNLSPYGVAKDQLNTVRFDPIEATDIRIQIKLQDGFSAGLLQLKRD
jgi:hypothetical protein